MSAASAVQAPVVGATSLPQRLKLAVAGPLARLDKLRTRDRLLLGAAMLALVIGLELLLVLPLRDKRLAIDAALQLGEADQQQAASQRQERALQREQELEQRAQSAGAALAAVGASRAPPESLRFLLSRTLQGLPVQVLSLRALGAEEITIDAPAAADAAAAAPASAGAGTGAAVPLFRHRYELRVGGGLDELLQAVEVLERQARPLRVERVQLRADAQGALQAGITLVTWGSERTWLAL